MKSVVGRRVFVGSVVAGLPLIAGAGARTLAQSRGAAGQHEHAADNSSDPVFDHLLREMAAVHNRMQRSIRGEDARAFASQLRTLAVYARAQDLDDKIKAALNETIRREGRTAVLYREHDPNAARQELARYGFQFPRQGDAARAPDFRVRAGVLDAVLAAGATPQWVRLADLLERIAPEIDRRNGSIVRVGLMRQDAAYWSGFCAQLDKELADIAEVVALFCGAVLWAGIFMQYQCMAATAAYSTMLAAKIAYC